MKRFLLPAIFLIAFIFFIAETSAQATQDSAVHTQADTTIATPADTSTQSQTDTAIQTQEAFTPPPPQILEPYHDHIAEKEIHPITKSSRQPAFLFWFIMFQLGLLAYLRISFPKSLEEMTRSLTNLTMAQQLYREQELSMPVSAIFYNVNFVVSAGIFIFLLNDHYGWKVIESPFVSMLSFLWLVIVLYALKYASMRFAAMVFPFKNEVNHYNFNFFLAQKVAGIILIPVNLLIAYSPEYLQSAMIIIALVMIAIFVIGVSLKGLEISRNLLQHNVFHYFIYICTLEIAPVCILVKVVVEWLS